MLSESFTFSSAPEISFARTLNTLSALPFLEPGGDTEDPAEIVLWIEVGRRFLLG